MKRSSNKRKASTPAGKARAKNAGSSTKEKKTTTSKKIIKSKKKSKGLDTGLGNKNVSLEKIKKENVQIRSQLERQNKQLEIEASLERVRERAMGMHHSDELSEVLSVLFEQFDVLGIRPVYTFLSLIELDKNTFDYRQTGKGGTRVIAKQVIDLDSMAEWRELFENMRLGKIDPVNCLYYPKESFNKVWEVFAEIYAALPEGSKVYPEDFPDGVYTTQAYCKFGYLGFDHTRAATDEEKDILLRFAKEFERLYRRFLDLQKAEAQAREAQIEAALERVRSRTMAMQHSSELAETSFLLVKQVIGLNIKTWGCAFNIFDPDEPSSTEWFSNEQGYLSTYKIPREGVFLKYYEAARKGEPLHVEEFLGEACREHYKYLSTIPGLADEMRFYAENRVPLPTSQYDNVAFTKYGYVLFVTYEDVPDCHDIFIRFAKVFEQTYTRFLDLQRAEGQAREARIEAALERIRSRSMAMHQSQELLEVITVVSEQLQYLNFKFNTVSFAINNQAHDYTFWFAIMGSTRPMLIKVPYIANPMFDNVKGVLANGGTFYADTLTIDESRHWHEHVFAHADFSFLSEETKAYVLNSSYARSVAITPSIMLVVSNYAGRPFSEDQNNIIKRFAVVFEQSYTRFLDLQKAEALAREAQIEASLERVRSKTMAMHNSQDVGDTVATLFDELKKLGVKTNRCGILIFSNSDDTEVWTARSNPSGEVNLIIGYLNASLHPLLSGARNAWVNKETTFSYQLKGKDLIDYYQMINSQSSYPFRVNVEALPSEEIHTEFYFPDGAVFAFTSEPIATDDLQIFRRLAGVFGQTYRRYLDLKKAEDQAREATIEAALEKVRGKAMAMHSTADLATTISTIFSEFRGLGIKPLRLGLGIINRGMRTGALYSAAVSEDGTGSMQLVGSIVLEGHPVFEQIYDSWINKTDYFPLLKGELLKSYYQMLRSGFQTPDWHAGYEQYGQFYPFEEGTLYAWSEKPVEPAEVAIFKRFRSVLALTYKRYNELQLSESNARDALRRASIDRVRAEIASMRTTKDLERITPLIWNELMELGVPFIRCGVFIMDEAQEIIHTYLSTPDGKAIGAFHLPYSTPGNIQMALSHWKKNEKYIDHWMEDAFVEFADTLVKQGALLSPAQYLSTIPHGGFYLHFLPFMQGMLYVGNTDRLMDDQLQLVESVADAFSTAYARYEDFKKLESAKDQIERTLTDLKKTQNQLVQAEKMASLGELTAGIAHEIQNPLNFVNNFSEVSKELLNEMNEEIDKGNLAAAKAINADVQNNLEKILHHGKRADGIVKGMLQHSRSSSGQKEPTDINGLADEYLRLAFHGFRAKDKSFNVSTKTDFDSNVGKVLVVPQDIGRVVLNLITNAFYAVSEKKKNSGPEYEPTVTLRTKRNADHILISVIDNGVGIPQKVLDKIFQPFFTTKPTGQGTGLGLSLSYDIVKAHAGEVRVETKESEGTEFIIQLPIN